MTTEIIETIRIKNIGGLWHYNVNGRLSWWLFYTKGAGDSEAAAIECLRKINGPDVKIIVEAAA